MSKNNTINMHQYAQDVHMFQNESNHIETVCEFQSGGHEAMMCHLENLVNTYGRDNVIRMVQLLKLTRISNKRQAS